MTTIAELSEACDHCPAVATIRIQDFARNNTFHVCDYHLVALLRVELNETGDEITYSRDGSGFLRSGKR